MHNIDPDHIYIEEENIKINISFEKQITITYLNDTVYIGNIILHPGIHNELKNSDGLDIRIFPDYKFVTIWPQQSKIYFKSLLDIKNKLKIGDYILLDDSEIDNLDISDFYLVFDDDIIYKYKISELGNIDLEYFELKYDHRERTFHILTPVEKIKSEDFKMDKHFQYIQSNNYWRNKIGNLDVAEYHLLMYEE